MRRRLPILLGALFFVAGISLRSEETRNLIVAERRNNVIELIDPATLQTIARVHVYLPSGGVGLNGVAASSYGKMLYVEGPIPQDFRGCCALYSIDLGTLKMKQAASIWGSGSRNAFVVSDGVVHPASTLTPGATLPGIGRDRAHLSPDHRSLFGVRSFRGPAIEIFDLDRGTVARELRPAGLEGDWWPSGTWAGDRFYLYAAPNNGSGRLWTVAPTDRQLGAGVEIAPFDRIRGCSEDGDKRIVAAADKLFLYELFGSKLDRRSTCEGVPGGAWIVDPATGRLAGPIAPDLHFYSLVVGAVGDELYGIVPANAGWDAPVKLVCLDAHDGSVLASRLLDSDFWHIASVRLTIVPVGDVYAAP